MNKKNYVSPGMIYTYVTINRGDAVMFTAIHTQVSGLCCLSAVLVYQKETRKVKGMPFMNI